MPTLYLNGWQVQAKLDDRRIVTTRLDTGETSQIALFSLERVVCIGKPNVTMPLLHALMEAAVPVVFLSSRGRWLNTLLPPRNGNALRRLRQYESMRQPELALHIAKALIDAKIQNMRRMLQRWSANRHQADCPAQTTANRFLQECRRRLKAANSLDQARGFEGTASACYFNRLADMLPDDMHFDGRSRRPPKDPVNALLSWTYAIVTAEIDSALRTAELDPCLGYLHELTTGRPSLSLDLLEPLRSPLCDALVLRLVNHRLLMPHHFETDRETGSVHLTRDAKRIFFQEYERTLDRPFTEARKATSTTFRKVIQDMANGICKTLERQQNPVIFHVA